MGVGAGGASTNVDAGYPTLASCGGLWAIAKFIPSGKVRTGARPVKVRCGIPCKSAVAVASPPLEYAHGSITPVVQSV